MYCWHGHVARHPESPVGTVWAWRGPQRWRIVQSFSDAGNLACREVRPSKMAPVGRASLPTGAATPPTI